MNSIPLDHPAVLAAATYLHTHSALEFCSKIEPVSNLAFLDARWPTLSSGELALWNVVKAMAEGDDVSVAVAASAGHLDARNNRAVAEAVCVYLDALAVSEVTC